VLLVAIAALLWLVAEILSDDELISVFRKPK